MLFFVLALTILHLAFASVVLFYRYEAYLIACAVLTGGILMAGGERVLWPQKGGGARWMAAWALVILLYPMLSRGWKAYKDTSSECLNSFEQSYQAAVFVRDYYNRAVVITDDIGVTSYFSSGKPLDLATGIGYTEIARSRENSYMRAEYVNYLIKQEKPALAIVRPNKYGYALLQHWIKAADWLTNNHVVLRSTNLSLYALDSSSAEKLRMQIRGFEPLLPSGVKTAYP
jgi:hypothetical protein